MRIIGVEAEALEELTMNIVNYEAASTIRTRQIEGYNVTLWVVDDQSVFN